MDKTEEFIELFIDVWKNGISGINISEILMPDIPFFHTSTNKFINCSTLSIFNLIYSN